MNKIMVFSIVFIGENLYLINESKFPCFYHYAFHLNINKIEEIYTFEGNLYRFLYVCGYIYHLYL